MNATNRATPSDQAGSYVEQVSVTAKKWGRNRRRGSDPGRSVGAGRQRESRTHARRLLSRSGNRASSPSAPSITVPAAAIALAVAIMHIERNRSRGAADRRDGASRRRRERRHLDVNNLVLGRNASRRETEKADRTRRCRTRSTAMAERDQRHAVTSSCSSTTRSPATGPRPVPLAGRAELGGRRCPWPSCSGTI